MQEDSILATRRAATTGQPRTSLAGVTDVKPFEGVLHRVPRRGDKAGRPATPDCFADLQLDRIVAEVTAGKEVYDLAPFFRESLGDAPSIAFRHEIVRDLADQSLLSAIKTFARAMQGVRDRLARADEFRHPVQKDWWVLDAANLYWACVGELSARLGEAALKSSGLRALRDFLKGCVASASFKASEAEGTRIARDLRALRYVVRIKGLRVQVCAYAGEEDFGAEILSTFQTFRQGAAREYDFTLDTSLPLNNIEGRIVDLVADIHAPLFSALRTHALSQRDCMDPAVRQFDREIQFYVSYLDYIARLEGRGLSFCLPAVDLNAGTIFAVSTFDLALASEFAARREAPVVNDFHLVDPERMIVVSGPNQGGKTTFARTFGQLHHLASLGLPVPGASARLALTDQILTHFERVERMASLRGKLQDDLIRIHAILAKAMPRSLLIVNELFSSTSLEDAIDLSLAVARQIIDLDALCVWVTFIEEVAVLGPQAVSMESNTAPEDSTVRTFKITRRPPSGLAHAMSIAEKHHLDHQALTARLGQ
jgi:hypothetical protein